MTGKVTVKEIKIVYTGKSTAQETITEETRRLRVVLGARSI